MGSFRRVVTGVNEDGESVFISDAEVEGKLPPLLGGNEIWSLFATTGTPTVPRGGDVGDRLPFFPAPGGVNFSIFSFPPESEVEDPPADLDAALAETERLTPGMGAVVTDAGEMHHTSTLDLESSSRGSSRLRWGAGNPGSSRPGRSWSIAPPGMNGATAATSPP